MINKVRIVTCSNRDVHVDKATTQSYACSYEYKGKIRLIDNFGNYRELSGADAKGVSPFILEFSKTKMFTEYVYEENEKASSFTDSDSNTKKIVELFWGKNPLCLVNGQAHTAGQSGKHYDLIDNNIKTMNSVHSFKDKLRAAMKLNEMKHSDRVDVAFFYGLHPIGKSEEELLVELGDSDNGYCLADTNLANFLKIWVDGKSEDRDLLVILKKAIDMEVISDKKTDGRHSYFLGESFLGSDETGMIDWVRKNPRDYNEHIVRKVSESEKKDSKVLTSIKTSNETKLSLEEFESLKKEAKALYVEGFIPKGTNNHSMTYDKLRVTVETARAAKAAAASVSV